MDLLWDRGFEVTPIGDFIDHMGLSRSSFCPAFGSKRAVLLELLEIYSRQCTALMEDVARSPSTPGQNLRTMAHQISQLDYGRGCFVLKAITERGCHDPDLCSIAAHHQQMLMDHVTRELRQLGAADTIGRAGVLIAAAHGASLLTSIGLGKQRPARL
ncbi:TetR/AcrR family transcriptional regulator [Paracoccus sediminilitoris]|uniref:TetR/AcrR family transcriptional regulator n=1 Tax=Paracoccus sediminilitoris TaxID=2202419 RepID=UPI000DB9D9F3|nr:TetR/AcrR family transcriptional regulator [Paracoccus sediminilitoris]